MAPKAKRNGKTNESSQPTRKKKKATAKPSSADTAEELRKCMQADPNFSKYYTIGSEIGRGEHSIVFSATAIRAGQTNSPVCVKVELQEGPGSLALLEKEQRVLRCFKGLPHLAYCVDWFPNVPYPAEPSYCINALVLPQYDTALDSYLKSVDVSHALLHHIAREMIDCLEECHSKGFVYRDIRADNFCVTSAASGGENPSLVLIDFGLSAEQVLLAMDRASGDPVVTGTEPYPSLRAEQHEVQSYRDDMESLGFLILQLHSGVLPWEDKPHADVVKLKEQVATLASTPPAMGKYFKHCRSLDFDDTPDYYELRACIDELGGISSPKKAKKRKTPSTKNLRKEEEKKESSGKDLEAKKKKTPKQKRQQDAPVPESKSLDIESLTGTDLDPHRMNLAQIKAWFAQSGIEPSPTTRVLMDYRQEMASLLLAQQGSSAPPKNPRPASSGTKAKQTKSKSPAPASTSSGAARRQTRSMARK